MSAPTTPDRAALAERLRKTAHAVYLATDARVADDLSAMMLAAAAALAAPALPPSVAEARRNVGYAMRRKFDPMANGTPGEYAAHSQDAERALDALIAAVRAATVAEAVRVVEPLATPDAPAVGVALAALRALADAPAPPAVPDDVRAAARRLESGLAVTGDAVSEQGRLVWADFRTLAAFVLGLP